MKIIPLLPQPIYGCLCLSQIHKPLNVAEVQRYSIANRFLKIIIYNFANKIFQAIMPVFECNFCNIRPILVLLKAIPYKSLKHQNVTLTTD